VLTSKGDSFSFEGEVEKTSIVDVSDASRVLGGGLEELSITGDESLKSSESWAVVRCEDGGGVFAGDDFWGEIDLARSGKQLMVSNCE
jgi:hypothetical protein